jgi:glycosyltransferase involved in cell wall biosynthesis
MAEFDGKRVLMLVENNPFPQDTRVRQEANALVKSGHQVTVVSPRSPEQTWREVLDGVKVYRYPAPLTADSFLGYIWEYGYSLVAMFVMSLLIWICEGFDIVHSANPPDTTSFIGVFLKLFGKKFIFDHHDLAPEMYKVRFAGRSNELVFKVLLWLEEFSCHFADHVIATNRSYKSIEMERGKVPEKRITIVRNGPDLDRLQPVEPDLDLRARGNLIIGYVGIIAQQDGVDYLLRALKHLSNDLGKIGFYCVIIGKGDELDSLIRLAHSLGLEDHVWFTGYVPDEDLIRILSSADICVDPDPSNPFNDRCTMIKMMEYMALGKPIVSFDLPEHRVTAQEAALYALPNNELDFARQIMMLMDDPERRRKMGQQGRERIEKELAWSHQEKYLLEVYESL